MYENKDGSFMSSICSWWEDPWSDQSFSVSSKFCSNLQKTKPCRSINLMVTEWLLKFDCMYGIPQSFSHICQLTLSWQNGKGSSCAWMKSLMFNIIGCTIYLYIIISILFFVSKSPKEILKEMCAII